MVRKYHPRTKPFRHQSKATLRAVKQGNHALFMDPGTGKTKAVLDAVAIQALRPHVGLRRVVVLCPLAAIGVWRDEIRTHFPLSYICEAPDERWQNLKRGGENGMTEPVHFFIVNYDRVSQRGKRLTRNGPVVFRHPKKGESLGSIKSPWVYPTVEKIQAFRPDLIVLDESHRTKKPGAVRSQALWRMVDRLREQRRTTPRGYSHPLPWVYLMTGTPNPKGYQDVFSQYRIMDLKVFGTNHSDFEQNFCVYGVGRNRFKIVAYRNKQILVKKILKHATVVPKYKALDLPPQMWEQIPVVLPKEARRIYNQMAEDLIVEIEGETIEALNAGTRRLRLLQITGGFTTSGGVVHRAKLDVAKSVLSDLFEQGKPSVVYAKFLPEVAALEVLCREIYGDSVRIDGSVPRRDRDDAVRRFQAGKLGCLVFQVETGSLAITLTKGSEVLFYSLPDAWDTYHQNLARVHRMGQKNPVTYRHLIAKGTLDVSVLHSLRDKSDMHGELMKTPREFLFGL